MGNVASQSSYPQPEPVLWKKLANCGPHNDDPYVCWVETTEEKMKDHKMM